MLNSMPQESYSDRNYSSRYWLDDNVFSKLEKSTSLENIMSLYSIKNTISNFIRITSNKSVNVTYRGVDSFIRDSKTVTISSDLNDFDKVVGLALHESSHISYSDLRIFERLYEVVVLNNPIKNNPITKQVPEKLEHIYKKYREILSEEFNNIKFFKDIKNYMNWIEDRRIDRLQIDRFPGYKQYYDKLYSHYFFSEEISKALKSKLYRNVDLYSYMFRITNSINKNSDSSALPGLKEIFNLIDIDNISKCNDNYESALLALDVFEIVYNECKKNDNGNTSNEKNNSKGKSKSAKSSNDNDSRDNNDSGDNADSDNDNDSSDSSSDSGDDDNNSNTDYNGDSNNNDNKEKDDDEDEEEDVSDDDQSDSSTQEDALEKMKEIEALLNQNDEITKEIIDETTEHTIKLLDSGELDILKPTEAEIDANVLSINKLTDEIAILFDSLFDHSKDTNLHRRIQKGISNGRILGKKLQIMNDTKIIQTIRKESGKINSRLLPEIGFGNNRIFSHSKVEEFNSLYVYLTLDSSGSMMGEEWTSVLQTAASIVTALSYVANARIVVSTRATTNLDKYETAFNMVIYDSKVNNTGHITKWWSKIRSTGNTPEGFVFDALMKKILKEANGTDAFFINFSDGCPSCRSYDYSSNSNFSYKSREAIAHTRKQVAKLIKNGISVISYYISSYGTNDDFTEMYGKASRFIDVSNITKLAATLNEMFIDRKRI